MDQNLNIILLKKNRFIIVIEILAFFLLSCSSTDELQPGYIYQDKFEVLWIPNHMHVSMYENVLSRFALIKDLDGKLNLYYKNDVRTPHSKFVQKDKLILSSDYIRVFQKDTIENDAKKRIVILALKQEYTRFAEFQYYPDSVDVNLCEKIISSLKKPQ